MTHARGDRVSVLVAAHSALDTIRAAVESILRCRLAELGLVEVIVAPDDGGDRYRDVLAGLPVIVLPPARDTGVGATRNRAFAASSGQWITMLDADDQVGVRYLDLLLDAAQSSRLAGAFSRTAYVRAGALVRRLEVPGAWIDGFTFASFYGSIHPLYHRSLWCEYASLRAQDVWVDAGVLHELGGRAPLAQATYFARLHDASVCARTPQHRFNEDYRRVLAGDSRKTVVDVFAAKLWIGGLYEAHLRDAAAPRRLGFHAFVERVAGAARAPEVNRDPVSC